MALVCTSSYVGHVRTGKDDSKVAVVCSGVPSRCHVIVFRSPNIDSQAISCMNLVWPKTMRGWDNSGEVCAFNRNRGGYEVPLRCRHWRAALSKSGDNSTGMSGERTGNGGIRTLALNYHLQKVDSNLDGDMNGKSPVRVSDSPDTIKSKDVSGRGPASTQTGGTVTRSVDIEQTSSYELSDMSTIPQSGCSNNGQENFPEQAKSFLEAEEKCVSLVWEAGSEIEKLTPEMAAMKDKNDSEDQKFSLTAEEEQRKQEEDKLGGPLSLELLPVVKISQHVSSLGPQSLNRRTATEGPVWIPKAHNVFYEFFWNLSKIQEKFWLMVFVHGKLAWIRLQQLLARRLTGLAGILANFPESENDLNLREKELLAFSDKLMNQSALHEEAYRRSQEALRRADRMVFQLNTQVSQLIEDVTSRDDLLRLLQKEASVSSDTLQRAAQSLSDAEVIIKNLEKRVQTGERLLGEERNKLAVASKSAGSLEEAARVALNHVAELTAEVSSLKALAAAGRRAEYLSAKVHALEKELRSRDSLLLEIKAETKRSTEALTVAAQIKQDLNTARQREVELTQALEGANSRVNELQTELSENLRSVIAEQALTQMKEMLRDANWEVQILRKGVEERDKAIYLMKDEVDLNMNLLSNATRDREELQKIKLQLEGLKADLGSKDNKLKIMREEMASVINLARLKQSTLSDTSSSDPTSLPAPRSNPSVQVSKAKKKIQSRKRTSSQRSSESSPQCS